jgi:hypothetical protein
MKKLRQKIHIPVNRKKQGLKFRVYSGQLIVDSLQFGSLVPNFYCHNHGFIGLKD